MKMFNFKNFVLKQECNMHSYVVHRQLCLTCASIVPGQQIHNNESQEAFQDSGYFSKISDISVVL